MCSPLRYGNILGIREVVKSEVIESQLAESNLSKGLARRITTFRTDKLVESQLTEWMNSPNMVGINEGKHGQQG